MTSLTCCPLCNSTKFRLFEVEKSEEKGKGFELQYQICTRCGLVFLSPCMDDEELKEYYRSGYRTLKMGSEKPTEKKMEQEQKRAESLAAMAGLLLKQYSVGSTQRKQIHLDIGCATGKLALAIQKENDTISYGIEPGEGHREYARGELENRVYANLDEFHAATQTKHNVDLVTMSHVIEHVPNPVEYLKELRLATLKPNGLVLLEVPNLYVHSCYEPSHLFAFTEKTLRLLFQSAGYEVLWCKLHGLPNKEKRKRYITMIGRALDEPVTKPQITGRVFPSLMLRRRHYERSKLKR